MAATEELSSVSEDWDGMHGLRWTGVGVIDHHYTTNETNAYLAWSDLPPIAQGETIDAWHRRVYAEDAGRTALDGTVVLTEGEPNGPGQ